ncbi:endonuclease dU [Caldiplasma sukawensis]
MKKGIRILGIDDGPFSRNNNRNTVLIGVLFRQNIIEKVLIDLIKVDGDDSTDKIITMINEASNCDVVMLQGVTFAGFNIVDIHAVTEKTGKKVFSVITRKPDIESMINALKKHNMKNKIDLLKQIPLKEVTVLERTYYINSENISDNFIKEVMNICVKNGIRPEPLRLADLIGKGFKKIYSL